MHRYWSTLRHLRHSPAQLLWFFIGATATVCWLKYKELERSHYAWSHPCIRSSIRLPELPSTSDTRNILKAINDFPLAGSSENQESHWNEENEALLSFGRLAGDKPAELSETALDKIICSVVILKANLARRRAERDQRKEERKENASF